MNDLSTKVLRYLTRMRKIQQEQKPWDSYCRNESWNGEACDNCGSTKKPSESNGRYIIGGDEDNPRAANLRVCGDCLEILENQLQLDME